MTEPAWRKYIRHPAVICGLLALVTLGAFARLSSFEFVNYDDPDYVTSNPHVKAGLSWAQVVWAFTTGHASNWHPLTWLSHILDWTLFGDHPAGHHLVSVALHIVNTILVFLVFRRMTGALWRSAMLAALFGLHPMHVESVAWVSERKDVLSGLFFLLTLGAYARYVEVAGKYSVFSVQYSERAGAVAVRRADVLRWYVVTIILFALGLMSKPMLVTVPFVLLLLDYWPLSRNAESATKSWEAKGLEQRNRLGCWGMLLLEKVPFLLLSLASSVVTFMVQRKGGAVSTSISLAGRIANAVVSYARYVGKLLCPMNLSVLYPHPGHWGADAIIGSSFFLLALFIVVFLLARGRRYLPVGWLWFVGMLVPAIGLVQVGIQSMADRYSYLPSIGLFVALVWGIAEFADRKIRASARGIILATASALALLVCARITVQQTGFWRNSESLFRRATQVTKNNYLAYNNLGFYLSGKGKIREAMENYEKALQIDPNYEDALNNIGFALAGLKRHQEAIPYYEKALRIKPKHAEVHNNLGNALAETGKIEEAITHYRVVLEQVPDHADAHNNLGIALAMQGKLDEAMTHFRLAIHFKPSDAGAHSNLGNGLAAQHKLAEAIKEYEESLRLRPEDSQAENNLGNVLAEQGKLDEAITHYQKSVSLTPDNPETRFNLSIVLIRRGNVEGAITNLTEALRLKPDYAAAQNELNRLRAQPH